ncbi:coiled-coil domain-containing protein 180-like [Clytia hemisphaerica]
MGTTIPYNGILRVLLKLGLTVFIPALSFLSELWQFERADQTLFEDTFLPLVGERKALFEYQSEKFEKHISEVSASQKLQFKSLFKYTQGIAHIWDIHEIGLTKEERQLQEMLDKNRREHDYQNQIKEAKLDIVMDRMRQDSSREALNGSLHQSLNMMEGIKKGYLEFHKQQRGLIEKYPKMIKEEVKRYATSMSSFFNAAEQGSKEYAEYAKFVKVLYSEELSNGVIYDILEPPDMDLPSTTASGGRSSPLSTKTFLTDLDDLDVERERMPYVESFALSPNLFEEYKKNICKEFLEHLQLWEEDSKTKAESIMMAKIEETNNELDLRLHLHDPRPGRAEKDVHDVRLTELTAHQDRVDQHCAGVLEALESIKRSYQDMSFGHLQENDKFRKSVEELEVSFTAASNTHELKAMQEEVHGKLDQFNEIIRASIRQFRNTLDTTLNKLRGSNAQFRKSLKIFSVGGNFSPEEVDEFRKRLERMASKIDHCEGNVTGELEGLENKRLEVAKENAGKLEDRFKHHLFDMTFIEKIKRWLTNIQVKIKAEVANSNSQGQHLSKMISVFNTKLKLIKNPQVDSEKFTASEAYETLIPILKEFRSRVIYLNCAIKKERVVVVIPTTVDTLVKTTLEKQREKAAMRGARNKRLPLQQKSSKLGGKGKKTSNLAQMAQLVQGGALSAASKQVLTATPKTAVASKSPLPPPPSETPSSATNDGGETAPSTPAPPKPTTAGYSMRRNSGVRTSLGGKYDKKYLAFGDPSQEPEKSDKHFLALQIKILQSGLDGLLSSAEHYYRQKGTRHPTRPKVINDTFDLCAESVIGRLRKYKTQTESYHNDCIQEFRAQIKLFNGIMIELPSLLMISLVTKHQNMRSNAQKDISNTLKSKIEISERLKKEHQTLLRPTLGHPNNKPELDKLKSSEKSRQKESEKSLDDYQKLMLDCINMSVRSFVIELNEKVNTLLSQFDVALTLDEVIIGDPKMKPKAEKELLRENQKQRKQEESEKQNQQQNLSKNEDQFETPTPHYWPKLDTSSLIESGILKATDFLTIPNSMKQTEAHKAVIKARDEEFQHFLDNQSLEREELKKSCDVIRNENERWKNNWKTSIKKITQLY